MSALEIGIQELAGENFELTPRTWEDETSEGVMGPLLIHLFEMFSSGEDLERWFAILFKRANGTWIGGLAARTTIDEFTDDLRLPIRADIESGKFSGRLLLVKFEVSGGEQEYCFLDPFELLAEIETHLDAFVAELEAKTNEVQQ